MNKLKHIGSKYPIDTAVAQFFKSYSTFCLLNYRFQKTKQNTMTSISSVVKLSLLVEINK